MTSADALVSKILDLTATRTFALESLLSLSSIEWSAEITTACVECAQRPRLLLNPDFVDKNCGTRERLAALILHELAHVSLGHTRLYPRGGWAHNVAFDAIINRDLSFHFARTGDAEPYTELFTSLYDPAGDPEFILRPPEAWPDQPQWARSGGCRDDLTAIHRRLYDPALLNKRVNRSLQVTYGEIIAALKSDLPGNGLRGRLHGRLLGGHGATDRERAAESWGRDAELTKALGKLFGGIDGIREEGRQTGPGTGLVDETLGCVARERRLELALAALLRKSFTPRVSAPRRTRQMQTATMSVDRSRDRRAVVKEALARDLGLPRPLLFADVTTRRFAEPAVAPIYLDVSGSMHGLVERLHAALVPLRRQLRPEIFAFSTTVEKISPVEFERRVIRTTGGTSIQPVLEHVLEQVLKHGPPPAQRDVLILTDGYFDLPRAETARALTGRGIRINLGVIGNGPLHDMESWIASSVRLPDNSQGTS